MGTFWPLGCGFESLLGQAWVKVVCAASDDPKMVKTLFAPVELAMSIYWVAAESLALTMLEMQVVVGLCPYGWSLAAAFGGCSAPPPLHFQLYTWVSSDFTAGLPS